MYKSLSRRSVPLIWVIATTIGITEQSSKNCIITCSLLLFNTKLMISDSWSSSSAVLANKQRSLERVWLKAGQWRSKCSKEPSAAGRQLGRRHFPDFAICPLNISLTASYRLSLICGTQRDLSRMQSNTVILWCFFGGKYFFWFNYALYNQLQVVHTFVQHCTTLFFYNKQLYNVQPNICIIHIFIGIEACVTIIWGCLTFYMY